MIPGSSGGHLLVIFPSLILTAGKDEARFSKSAMALSSGVLEASRLELSPSLCLKTLSLQFPSLVGVPELHCYRVFWLGLPRSLWLETFHLCTKWRNPHWIRKRKWISAVVAGPQSNEYLIFYTQGENTDTMTWKASPLWIPLWSLRTEGSKCLQAEVRLNPSRTEVLITELLSKTELQFPPILGNYVI